MGQAVARRLRADGCDLTLTGRRGDVLGGLAGELRGRSVTADLADRGELLRVVDVARDVDVLVTCADVGGVGELTDYSLEQLDLVLQVNLTAPLVLARMLGERMLERGSGQIVFVSSLAGKTAAPGASLRDAAMFGVRGFALGLRQDWSGRGVGVSLVNLGPIGESVDVGDGALPAGFRPKAPADVAAAVVKAIKHDRAEVDVADPVMRAGVVFGQVAPRVAARFGRLAGGER